MSRLRGRRVELGTRVSLTALLTLLTAAVSLLP